MHEVEATDVPACNHDKNTDTDSDTYAFCAACSSSSMALIFSSLTLSRSFSAEARDFIASDDDERENIYGIGGSSGVGISSAAHQRRPCRAGAPEC